MVHGKNCPQFVKEFHGFEETVEAIKNVAALSKQINLEVEADVTELLASHGEKLSAKDLIQLEKQILYPLP